MFIVPKLRATATGSWSPSRTWRDPAPARWRVGRSTPSATGHHSYEIALDDWFVPAANLIVATAAEGRASIPDGRVRERPLQTAARAVGVMQAAYEAAVAYAENRVVFGTRSATTS